MLDYNEDVHVRSPTRAAGLDRLEAFLPKTGDAYAKNRNFDLGPGRHSHVSRLSPWVRHRLVAEEEVVRATLSRFTPSTAEKFIQEVFWRTYWKRWLERRPGIWSEYCRDLTALRIEQERDVGLAARIAAAECGSTGIECFDAWAHELLETGYLHNHARMWFASIWIFTLKLPWQMGAGFFLRHLLDGDPASNTLSWRWVAGLQTRGKTYLARPDNIERFTEGRFSPKADQLASQAEALPGPIPPAPLPAPEPAPITPDGNTGLLITEEDLSPEWLVSLSGARHAAVLGPPLQLTSVPFSEKVQRFKEAALNDTERRLADKVVQTHRLSDQSKSDLGLVEWAQSRGLNRIVTAYVPVGPTRDWMEERRLAIESSGINTVFGLRTWDRLAWPHATKGFFPFKEKIGDLLQQLELI